MEFWWYDNTCTSVHIIYAYSDLTHYYNFGWFSKLLQKYACFLHIWSWGLIRYEYVRQQVGVIFPWTLCSRTWFLCWFLPEHLPLLLSPKITPHHRVVKELGVRVWVNKKVTEITKLRKYFKLDILLLFLYIIFFCIIFHRFALFIMFHLLWYLNYCWWCQTCLITLKHNRQLRFLSKNIKFKTQYKPYR